MKTFKKLFIHTDTIQGQQRLVIMIACFIVIMISLGSSLTNDLISFNRDSRNRLVALADIIAADVSAALVFGDNKTLDTTLRSIAADPSILHLFVLDKQNITVGWYSRESRQRQVPVDHAYNLDRIRNEIKESFFELSPEVARPIMHDGEQLGTIIIEMDSNIFLRKLLISGSISLTILLFSSIGAYLLARRLGRIIASPILTLADTMDEVTRTKDYRLRVDTSGVKELARLSDGFNEMLSEIAKRDEALLERQERLHRMANYDTLTGLPNRALFNDRFAQALRRSERLDEQLAILFIDLDDFKLINDTHGHRIGDLLLVEVAKRLEKGTRADDTLARLGGDEFIIFLHNVKTADNALMVARKHLNSLLEAYLIEDKQLFISASIGISIFPDHGSTTDILVKSADAAMYQAKQKGKNHVEQFTESLYCKVSEKLALQSDLRRALEHNEFIVNYQPRINLQTGYWSGVEALVRWYHPTHGLISPLTFIPLAEETGMIMQLGEWVLNEACQQLNRWNSAGINLQRVSVNVSPLQFRRQNIVEMVNKAISKARIAPQSLELEITESALMDDLEQSIIILRELQQLGVSISIDDFGTGYSSLSILRSLPVNIIKVDRSFVMNAHDCEEDAQILSAIIAMSHSLHLDVVAEGVELVEHEELLLSHRCHEAQGYYYAKPMKADDLTKLLVEHTPLTINSRLLSD